MSYACYLRSQLLTKLWLTRRSCATRRQAARVGSGLSTMIALRPQIWPSSVCINRCVCCATKVAPSSESDAAVALQYLANRAIVVQYAYNKDSPGERHGSAAGAWLYWCPCT